MIKSINIATSISKDLTKDSLPILEQYNLHIPFDSIYLMDLPTDVTNTLICAIIFSYDSHSQWCDLKKTSYDDKIAILQGLHADLSNTIFNEFIDLSNDDINDSIGSFLDTQIDWRFAQIMRSRDYHSKALRTPEPEFKEMDEDKTIKAKEGIGKLLREGLNHRKLADEYLLQIEKDFVNLNHRTKQDFGVDFTTQSTQRGDIMSWRVWIRELNEKKKATV